MIQSRNFICDATGEPCADTRCMKDFCALDLCGAHQAIPPMIGTVSRVSDAQRFKEQAEAKVSAYEQQWGKKLHRAKRQQLIDALIPKLTRQHYERRGGN